MILVLLLFFALVAAQQPANRLVLSYVRSDSVQISMGTDKPYPLQLQWFFENDSRATPVGTAFAGLNRAGSYEIVEQYLTDWVPFRLGARLYFEAKALGASEVIDLGSVLVNYFDLITKPGRVFSYALNGGSIGFRLVDVASTNAIPAATSTIVLGVLNAGISATNNQYFPKLSFRCFVSRASFPGTEVLNGTISTSTSLDGAITRYNVPQPVNRVVTLWSPRVIGSTLVCGVYQDDSRLQPFRAQPDMGLGVVSVLLADFPNASGSFGIPYNSSSFFVTLGPCPACTSSSASGLEPLPAVALAIVTLAMLLFQ